MDNQRLRNITTGILHTKMSDVYEDLGTIIGVKGLMTTDLPLACNAVRPFLKGVLKDPRFWDKKYDPGHTGETEIPEPGEAEREFMYDVMSGLRRGLSSREACGG